MSNSTGFKEGRDSRTGKFKSVEDARSSPATSTVELVPKQGEGVTGRYDKPKKQS